MSKKSKKTLSLEEANETLSRGESPGIVVFEDDGTPSTLYKHVRDKNNGWVHTVGFNEVEVDYAPGVITCIEWAETLVTDIIDNDGIEFDSEWFEYVLANDIEVL